MTAQIGMILRKVKKRLLSNYFVMSAVPMTAFGVLATSFSVLTYTGINQSNNDLTFAFNYIPIIFSASFLICSVILSLLVVLRAYREIPRMRSQAGTDDDIETSEPASDEGSETGIECPDCGVSLAGGELVCPKCRENLNERCE